MMIHPLEAAKMRAETRKLTVEAFWHPVMVGAGLMGAGAAFATALIGAIVAILR